ncbi:MAG: class I SAM-dependent methyltransferase [Deltaproteobacteria bacterium]|nr:class I SAM-dependent methyltransferase [Deltaproteobacteria bacterium]
MLTSAKQLREQLTSHSKSIDIGGCKTDPVTTMEALLKYWPMSHSIRELVRMRALAEWGQMELPLLDVGCGNGLFWEAMVKSLGEDRGNRVSLSGILGVDIDPTEVNMASARLRVRGASLRVADITSTVDIPSLAHMHGQFRTIFANCSLEHVPRLDEALKNIRSFLREDGRFILVVPAPRWTDTLKVKQFLGRISHRLAGSYAGAIDGFFQHYHLYPSWVWHHLLSNCGFTNIQMIGVGNQSSNNLYEKWLPSAMTGFVSRCFLGRYPKYLWSLKRAYFRKQTQFIEEIQKGQTFSYDLNSPFIEEYAISCRAGVVQKTNTDRN